MTAVDVAPITVLHVFKKDVAKVPPLEEQQVGHCKMTKVIGNNFCLCWFRPKKVKTLQGGPSGCSKPPVDMVAQLNNSIVITYVLRNCDIDVNGKF